MAALFFEVHYFLKEDNRDAFMRAIKEAQVAELSRKEKGNLRYDYFFPAREGTEKELVLLELWTDSKAQKAHTGTPHFAKLAALKEVYVEKTEVKTGLLQL